MSNVSAQLTMEREDLYKSALLRFKKEAKEAKKLREKEINDEAKKIIFLENIKRIRGKISIKRRLDNFSVSLEKKIPRINLAAQIPKSERFSFDGGEAGVEALDTEDMSDYVQEGEEGQTQVNLKKVKKEIIERVKKVQEAKEKVQQVKRAAEAVKVAKASKNLKTILNIIKAVGVITSLIVFGVSLIITYLVWVFQVVFAHILRHKYIPKLAKWEWICFAYLTLILFLFLASISLILMIPALVAALLV